MRHQPTPLALLISLIGLGVSPYACARSELRVGDPLPSALDIALAQPAATALERTRWAPDLAWRSEDGARDAPLAVIGVASGPYDDESAPGESIESSARIAARATEMPDRDESGSPDADPPPSGEAAEATEEAVPKSIETEPSPSLRGLRSRVRSFFVERFAPMREIVESDDRASMVRSERVPVSVAQPISVVADSAHADRLLETLAAIVLADAPMSHSDLVLARLAERFPASFADAPVAPARTAGSAVPQPASHHAGAPRTERREFIVESASDKVLRNLEAILFPERDEAGAIKVGPVSVATQSDKVLGMLGDVLYPRAELEDGTARRARKLAAIQAKAEAKKEAAVAIAAPQEEQKPAAAAEPAAADPAPKVRTSPFGGERVALSEASLESVRGGFVTEGLNISFGIERAVYINGSLVTTTTLNVSDLGRITAGQASTKIDAGTMALIQNGTGNIVASGANLSPTSVGTIVQNTLDGQKVQTVTVINATVNSLGVLRSLNLQSSLRSAVIDSLRR